MGTARSFTFGAVEAQTSLAATVVAVSVWTPWLSPNAWRVGHVGCLARHSFPQCRVADSGHRLFKHSFGLCVRVSLSVSFWNRVVIRLRVSQRRVSCRLQG